jgi:hypothetical protein
MAHKAAKALMASAVRDWVPTRVKPESCSNHILAAIAVYFCDTQRCNIRGFLVSSEHEILIDNQP